MKIERKSNSGVHKALNRVSATCDVHHALNVHNAPRHSPKNERDYPVDDLPTCCSLCLSIVEHGVEKRRQCVDQSLTSFA